MKRALPKIALASFVATALLSFAGCGKPAADSAPAAPEQTIAVGEFASLTGINASFGQMSHHGTEMAIAEINAAGGVLGKKIKLITEDDQSKAGEAATGVQKLISRDHVVAILGEVASSRSMEAAPICQRNKIPMISPASTNVKLTEMGDHIFRTCFTDQFQGLLLSNFAQKTLRAVHVALLTDVKSDYSVGLARDFKTPFTAGGGQVVVEQSYSTGDKDFRAQLTAIKTANPDAVFIPGYYSEVGLIAQQARQLGLTVPLFGGDGWESSVLLELGGAALDGTYFSTHFSPEAKSPEVQTFVKNFQTKYGATPDTMAALGYDSALILAGALKRAGGVESEKLTEAIGATKDFPGITGKITLDEKRNANKAAVILTVRGGKFEFVENVSP